MDPTLMVVGVNHRTAPVGLRERFWIPEDRRGEAMVQLTRAEGIDEVVVLATCSRTEFLLWTSDVTLAANSVMRLLATTYGLQLCEWKHFYRLLDEAALLHIFRVASGLDSAEIGEPQIVSEVQEAWKQAQKTGSTGRCLDAVLKKALTFSERVRNEAAIGNPAAPIPELEELLRAEAQECCRALRAQRVVPTIVALRQRLNEICRQELDSFRQENGPFTQDQVELLNAVVSRMTQRITGSLARELKELPEKVEQEQMTTAVQRLFHLQTPEAALAGTSFYGE